MLNATLRADGSSKFARGNRYGVFPSISAGWTLSNEKFMQNTQNWLDYLKLRASWGQVGKQNIDNYQYTAPITSSNTHYIFGTADGAPAQSGYLGAYPSRLANESVTWETSEQTNIGFLPVPSKTSKVRNRATFIMRISIDRHSVVGARSCTITYIGMIPIVKAFSQCSGFGLQISTRIAIYFHSD